MAFSSLKELILLFSLAISDSIPNRVKIPILLQYELNALRSASAIPISDELPSSLKQDLPMRSEQEVVGGMKASNMMLSRLPDLHFDNALQSMLSIADLLVSVEEEKRRKSIYSAHSLARDVT